MAKIIKGKYYYKDEKKLSKKEMKKLKKKREAELFRKQDKELRMQCDCNHLDAKHNKSHFKKNDDGTITCKICGGRIINDPNMITRDAAESAKLFVYTVFSLARNKLALDEETDKKITKALLIVSRMPELIDDMKGTFDSDHKKKKKKKKNGKKNKNKGFNRISY